MEWDRDYNPPLTDKCDLSSGISTIHFSAGRKEKISKGDIVGFLIANAGLQSDEIGKINVFDHEAIAAVPSSRLKEIISNVEGQKLKNKKIKITAVRP